VEKRGKSVSNAIQMAIGIVKNWASGKGNVDSNTRAAAAKAVAQWTALKAKNKARKGAKKLAEATEPPGHLVRRALEEAKREGKLKCPKCDHMVPRGAGKCSNCGHDMSKARGAVGDKLS
jgi:rubrerythrin